MRIVCPNCTAAYDVPDRVVVAPRKVRCARCKTDFSAAAAVPAAQPSAAQPSAAQPSGAQPSGALPPPSETTLQVAPPVPMKAGDAERLTPADMPPADAARTGRGRMAAVLAAWALSLALLAGGAWAGIARRDAVMRSWPASNRLYAALGYVR